jgi:hypothetical protein
MISPLQWQGGPKRVVASTKICASASGDFMKSHSISPDGSQVLISSESNFLACWLLGESPRRTQYYNTEDTNDRSDEDDTPKMACVFNMGESIHDFAWHPYIDPTTNQSCYFVATTKDHPVHMMDSYTGTSLMLIHYLFMTLCAVNRENKV